MVAINYATREVTCKIVYYGPGLSGKTTNLIYVHKKIPATTKGKMISLATEADRTLYFDFLPINIGSVNGFTAKFQLYTVPGQVYYNATRKLVLRGVDGIVFVADSQADKMDENVESLTNMKENLEEYGYDYRDLPIVIQYNKRDLPGILPVAELEAKLNTDGWKSFEGEAVNGAGVFDTLKMIIKLVLAKAQSSSKKEDKKPSADLAPSPPVEREAEAASPAQQAPAADAEPEIETPASVSPPPEPAAQKSPGPPPVEEQPAPATEETAVDDVPGLVRHNVYDADSQKETPVQSDTPPRENIPEKQDSGMQQVELDTGPVKSPLMKEPATVSKAEEQPAGRPFPGSSTGRLMRRERRITVSDFQPASRDQESDSLGSRLADEKMNEESEESKMPAPTMAPSTRMVKKKRGFFKRLFGIK